MGNISNPIVTRLGINQFFSKNYAYDNNRPKTLQKDKLLKKTIQLYLDYGLTTTSSMFIHEYWFNKFHKKTRTAGATDYSRVFRRYYYTNTTLGIEHSYLVRNVTPEYFPMKVWLIQYGGWYIVSVHWYKPIKSKVDPFSKKKKALYLGTPKQAPLRTNSAARARLASLYLTRGLAPLVVNNYSF